MKPWLFEILACPIDKHYPLKLFVFKFEDQEELLHIMKDKTLMEREMRGFFLSPLDEQEPESDIPIVNMVIDDGVLLIHDALARKPVGFKEYLTTIARSIEELRSMHNKAGERITKVIEDLISFSDRIRELIETPLQTANEQEAAIKGIEDKLILLNWFKQGTEIETGLLACEKCNRWYPIRETIPQMKPDELRQEETDKPFLEEWKESLDESITLHGKPFHL
ncbi:MAG: Trm112 family protein [Promethearchaeota archaeon]